MPSHKENEGLATNVIGVIDLLGVRYSGLPTQQSITLSQSWTANTIPESALETLSVTKALGPDLHEIFVF